MANLAKQLLELQEVDLELNERRARIQAIEAQLVESEALIAARNDVARVDGVLTDLRKSQREEETESADLGAKIKPLDDKLYGGSIKVPKELASLQAEIDHLKANKKTHEDKLLDIMEQLESANAEFKAGHEKMVAVEQTWKADQAALFQEKEAVTAQVAELLKKRDGLRTGVPAPALEAYDSLAGPKLGKVVARVERGACQGCRVSLPMSDIHRARAGKDLVRCSNCGRILLVG